MLILLTVLLAASAEAGLEVRPFFLGGGPDGTLTYGYRVRLVSGRLDPASPVSQHVTLYDIPRLVPGSASGAAVWAATEQGTGVDAADVPMRNRDDAPRHMNITWRWTGTEIVDAPAELGTISFTVLGPEAPLGTTILYIGQSSTLAAVPRPVAIVGRVGGPGVP